MATPKKTTTKATKPAKKTTVSKPVEKTNVKPVVSSEHETKTWKDTLTRCVLVFETGVLYFIILFILFVLNNFTVMFYPKW